MDMQIHTEYPFAAAGYNCRFTCAFQWCKRPNTSTAES
jgi:hypothetical protein